MLYQKNKDITFEDLKGLKAEGYIRDSTKDQAEGFGPDTQRHAVEQFARLYGLILGEAWYTDFVSGRSIIKRQGFLKAISDAKNNYYDVLLVYHTSRFARNRADAIKYKQLLKSLSKTIVFVSQGIISGRSGDFLSEGINELIDEQHSITISTFVAGGLSEKFDQGWSNGKPPLGYRSQKTESGNWLVKVPDPKTMPALLELLRLYATGKYSYAQVADILNSRGHHTRLNRPFTKGSVETVIINRFYNGEIIYHPGQPDEKIKKGNHEVPEEVRSLWLKCQEVRKQRELKRISLPTTHRVYPLSGVLICDRCGRPYHGEASGRRNGKAYRQMHHHYLRCGVKPVIVQAHNVEEQFTEYVINPIQIDDGWRTAVMAYFNQRLVTSSDEASLMRLDNALENLRKQHLWGDITDEKYRKERHSLQAERQSLLNQLHPRPSIDLEQAAKLLQEFPKIWDHPAVTNEQRQAFIHEAFAEARIDGRRLTKVLPKPQYAPLFAYSIWINGPTRSGGSGRGERT